MRYLMSGIKIKNRFYLFIISMKNAFENLEKWQKGIWLVLKWIGNLLFVESIIWYRSLVKKYLIKRVEEKNYKIAGLALFPLLAILAFVLYWFHWLYVDWEKIIHRSYYTQALKDNYKEEIKSFFEKYEEMFKARDCGYMSKVSVDLSMYTKYWRESYGEDYKCPEFDRIQEVRLYPVKVYDYEKFEKFYRVNVDVLRMEILNGKPREISAFTTQLWRKPTEDLWHWNPQWRWEERALPAEMKF